MDPITTQAIALALSVGTVVSLLQERFWGDKLDGKAALILTVALSLGCGVVAAFRVGITIAAPTADPIGFAVEALKAAGYVLVASQAAFRVLTNPVAQRTPTP